MAVESSILEILQLLKKHTETVNKIETSISELRSQVTDCNERLNKIGTVVEKKPKQKVSKLAPYRADLTLGVTKMVFQPLKETDNKVVFALICDDVSTVDKDGYYRHPSFSFTLRQFLAFMETYNECSNGDLITLTDAKHNVGKFFCTKTTPGSASSYDETDNCKWIGE